MTKPLFCYDVFQFLISKKFETFEFKKTAAVLRRWLYRIVLAIL